MNYFNYFTEIEDAFIRRRGKHLLLSPMDWALIESWKEMDLPLHVALRGIEKAFDSWEAKARKRTVKTLLYCQEEVEAQYAEWREARVGTATAGQNADDNAAPFNKSAILKHLQQGRKGLLAARDQRNVTNDLTDALERTATILDDLERDFASTAASDTQKLEQSLTGLERLLSDALRRSIDRESLTAMETEISEQLKPYRKQMQADMYNQTINNLLLKKLRDRFGIPRLSLFYL